MKKHKLLFLLALIVGWLAPGASADPCGMVPPVYLDNSPPIERTGLQRTYVFFKDGVESFVIRPGYTGKVDNFGMLIPFPSVPSLRKVADPIFPHLEAAIDPPEVVVNLIPHPCCNCCESLSAAPAGKSLNKLSVLEDKVQVMKEEAVGMYEVAVLKAGSVKALSRWMKEHKYQYPKGMDDVCAEYITAGWCFVAVKTRVGKKGQVDPKAGMRNANAKLPDGAGFDGHVQAMGFRFYTEELVVPMRLSAFNDGDSRNIVYLLTDSPKAIHDIPEKNVKRQLSGDQLYLNLTQPLPLRVIGGEEKDIPSWQRQGLDARRDQAVYNRFAKELFASDLLSARMNKLAHAHEEAEKVLLRISERMGLRGEDIDKLHEKALVGHRDTALDAALVDILGMTLTVIDGDFEHDVIANQNLSFFDYRMPDSENTHFSYHAADKKAAGKREGNLIVDGERRQAVLNVAHDLASVSSFPQRMQKVADGALAPTPVVVATKSPITPTSNNSSDTNLWIMIFALVAAIGIGFSMGKLSRSRVVSSAVILLALGFVAAIATPSNDVQARVNWTPPPISPEQETLEDLVSQLGHHQKAEAALAELIKRKQGAVPVLLREAFSGNNILKRGWALVGLTEIGGEGMDDRLKILYKDTSKPELVRNWALAGRVQLAESTKELQQLADMIPSHPILGRPIGKRLMTMIKNESGDDIATHVLSITLRVPKLQQQLSTVILGFGAKPLVRSMTSAKDQNVRRQAAAYLAALDQRNKESDVAAEVIASFDFSPDAKNVPWAGGPLFIPGIQWEKEPARELVSNLMSWMLWAHHNNQAGLHNQLHNNLRSLSLARAAGYSSPAWRAANVETWLRVWGNAIGKNELGKMLEEQNLHNHSKYVQVLKSLNK